MYWLLFQLPFRSYGKEEKQSIFPFVKNKVKILRIYKIINIKENEILRGMGWVRVWSCVTWLGLPFGGVEDWPGPSAHCTYYLVKFKISMTQEIDISLPEKPVDPPLPVSTYLFHRFRFKGQIGCIIMLSLYFLNIL